MYPNVQFLNLHVWVLSSVDCERKIKYISNEATELISHSKRPSTRAVYDAKWRVFSNWCCGRHIDPGRPSIPEVADFLIFLFNEKKCQI